MEDFDSVLRMLRRMPGEGRKFRNSAEDYTSFRWFVWPDTGWGTPLPGLKKC
jgi:hypothetical protein